MEAPTLLSPLLSAKVLADSISHEGVRLTTMELVYPRFIHAEFMTHRVFSRNASSSRAIPTKRALSMILENPAVPASWRMNQPGMQGYEVAADDVALAAQAIWLNAMSSAIEYARQMDNLGIHKQVVNRITEPFAHIKVVVTGVYWENWNGLRNHHAADPTIAALAEQVWAAREASTPVELGYGEWHLPYITEDDWRAMDHLPSIEDITEILIKISAARCARVSYNNHDGTASDVRKDISLHDTLLVEQPIHASPAEHQATPDFRVNARGMWFHPEKHGNLHGWIQYRKTLENENMDCRVA